MFSAKFAIFLSAMTFALVSVSHAQLANTKIAFVSDRDGNSEIYIILKTAVDAHVHAQGTEPIGFSTAPQFTKMVNSSMASNGWLIR